MSEQTKYRGYGRPRKTDANFKPNARRRRYYLLSLEAIRAKFALDPSHGIPVAEGMIGSPRVAMENKCLVATIAPRPPLLTARPKAMRRKRTDFRTAEDTSPQWVRELRAAYCDHFIKTGELDERMSRQLRVYANACHTGEVLQGAQHADHGRDDRIRRGRQPRGSGVFAPPSRPLQRGE